MQDSTANKAGKTTGFSTGKKLPHAALSSWKQPHQAYSQYAFTRWRHLSTHQIIRPTTRLLTPEG